MYSDQIRADRVADLLTESMIKSELIPAYRDSLRVIKADIAHLYEQHSVMGELSVSDVRKYNRLKNLEQGIASEMSKLRGKQVRITSKTIKGVYQESYYRVAHSLEKLTEVRLGFGLLPRKQIEAALVNPMDRIGWKDRTLEQARIATRQIREEITRGIVQGKGYPEVAKTVTERLNIAAGRAERIVRTEAHRVRETGKVAGFEHAARRGIDLEKVWSSTLDENTRSSHQELDQQRVPVFDEQGNPGKFTSPTGAQAEYPGGFGLPEEDIKCRCGARGQIAGFAPEMRATRGEGYIPHTNYADYAREKGWTRLYKGPEPKISKPKQVSGEWQPAKTKAEALQRLTRYSQNTPAFPDASLETLNQIDRGLHTANSIIAGGRSVAVTNLGWIGSKVSPAGMNLGHGVSGVFTWRGKGTSLLLRKAHITRAKQTYAKQHAGTKESFRRQVQQHKQNVDLRIKRGDPVWSIQGAKEQLELTQSINRWTVALDSGAENYVAAITAHEAAHAIEYRYALETPFRDMLEAEKVTERDIFPFSRYGATNAAELFAEVVSAISIGRANIVPRSIMRAFQRTLKYVL